MKRLLQGLLLLGLLSIPVTQADAQSRDFRAERLVLDDGNGNTMIIQTPAGPITGGTLTIPDPGGAGQFLISNPAGGSQSVSGDLLPGADDTYDLGSGASRWQDLFLSGNVSVGGGLNLVETGGGTDVVGFQAPAAVTANQIWTLPAADGTGGQALVTDGAGNLSWATAGGTVSTNTTINGDGSGGSPLGINLAQGNTWTGTQQFNASFTILGNGRLALTNNDNNARDVRWQEPSGTGSQYIGLRAPSVAQNSNYVFPASIGAAGDVLAIQTVGTFGDSATLEWVTPAGGGTVSTNATINGDGSAGSPLGINLAQGNTWTGLQQFNASFTILGNGRLALTNNDNNARDIRWQEPSGTGSQYVGIRAPTVAQNSNYVFPASIGTAGQVLALQTVNGFGDSATLTWVNNAATAPLSLSNNSNTNPTVTLANSNATGVALELTDGRLIVSSSTTDQAGGTIPDDVVMVRVADDGGATTPSVTLPANPSEGQILYLVVEDANGVNITDTLTAGVDPTGDGLFMLVYLNSGWSVSN